MFDNCRSWENGLYFCSFNTYCYFSNTMSKRKFILLSILKTWLISTIVSTVLLIVFMSLTKPPEVREHPRNCDMSGLAYGLVIIWILFLSIASFSSLFSLLRPAQSKIKTFLCWFLLPILFIIYYFFMITEGKVSGEDILFFLIANLPWLALWVFYYFKSIIKTNEEAI